MRSDVRFARQERSLDILSHPAGTLVNCGCSYLPPAFPHKTASEGLSTAHRPPRLDTRFVCLAKRGLPPFRNIDPSLTPPRVQFTLPTLVVSGFSLISRCTYRAHAAF